MHNPDDVAPSDHNSPNGNTDMRDRRFFHSFPRPKQGESESATLDRGLKILAFMKQAGLVLAPETVIWDVSGFSHGATHFSILQRRVSFTELSLAELPAHSTTFGPIALSFDIAALRSAGATPVIYVPQGVTDSPLSQIATFCVHGAYHTKYVLSHLQQLKDLSDPAKAAAQFNLPVSPNYELTLTNVDSAGKPVAEYKLPASDVRSILTYVGFNCIPFDHSAGILGYFLNLFYPTDNAHSNDQLGYYRQREWRIVADNVNIKGRPIGRPLSNVELSKLHEIDNVFWDHELTIDGHTQKRSALALMYDPLPDWKFFNAVSEIYVPGHALERIRSIVGESVPIHASPPNESSPD